MSERERELTARVSGLEVELSVSRRLYYKLESEKDTLLKAKNREVKWLHGVVSRLNGEVSTGGTEVERLRKEVARLTPNVTGTSNKKKAEMLLARLNGNV